MITEIEVKFLNVNHDEVRAKLQALGAVCEQPMRTMRRAIIDYPDRRLQTIEDGFVRVRDEGDKTTLTYKTHKKLEVGGAQEIETVVNDYQTIVELLKAIGLCMQSEQVTKRETWKLDNVEVVLDEWPWLKPYIEVEADSEAAIRRVSNDLGFDWSQAIAGDVNVAYRIEYPNIGQDETIGTIPVIDFDQPLPQWLKDRQ